MNNRLKIVFFVIWLGLMLWGLVGVFQRLTEGHLLANYGSYVPWGLWVAAKVYFVGLGVGVSLLVWIIYAFNIQRLRSLTRLGLFLAVITMVAGNFAITFDLGHMERMYEIFTRPNFTSLVTLASWFAAAYGTYVALVLLFELKAGQNHLPTFRLLGWIGILFALTFSTINGSEFATLISSSYWNTALGPILSMGGALLSGTALLVASIAFFPVNPEHTEELTLTILNRIIVSLIVFLLVLEWSEYLVSMWYGVGENYTLLRTILFGKFWYVFWIIHLLLGSAIPLGLLLWRPGNRLAAGLGGALVAITFFSVRVNEVIPGQITPALKGLQEAYTDSRLKFAYVPSPQEWAVLAFAVALYFALFYLGKRFLPLAVVGSEDKGGQ